jgi:methanogenic corrinoid protein MtbC1
MEVPGMLSGKAILSIQKELAEIVTSLQFQRDPSLVTRYGERGRAKTLQDTLYNLGYLAEAVSAASPELFVDYVGWAKIMLAARNVRAEDFAANLEIIREVLLGSLPDEIGAKAAAAIDAGLKQCVTVPSTPSSHIQADQPLHDLAERYLKALLRADRRAASKMIMDAVQSGIAVKEIYLFVFQQAQREIGRLWQTNMISVAQEHYCTAATQLIISQLYPRIFATEKNGLRMVATCVSGELHEIGMRMVSDFFEMEGWDTYYLGGSMPVPDILRTVSERRAHVLAISATMTFHIDAVIELVAAARASREFDNVRILVGGYPFNLSPKLWERVGADGFSRDAAEAMALVKDMRPQGTLL